MKETNTVLV